MAAAHHRGRRQRFIKFVKENEDEIKRPQTRYSETPQPVTPVPSSAAPGTASDPRTQLATDGIRLPEPRSANGSRACLGSVNGSTPRGGPTTSVRSTRGEAAHPSINLKTRKLPSHLARHRAGALLIHRSSGGTAELASGISLHH